MTRTLLIALALALLTAAPAQADITVSNVTAAPQNTAAGAHSNFTLAFDLGGSSPVKNLDIDLPAGLVGNPSVPAKCTEEQFQADSCPPASQVGTQTVNATIDVLGNQDLSGQVFNLVPNKGEPARLGIKLDPPGGVPLLPTTRLESSVRIRSESDFGLTSTIKDIPNQSNGLNIKINKISLTLNADANGGKFEANPTSCNAAQTTVRATGYDATTGSGSGSFTPTACDALPFAPKLTATAGAEGLTGVGKSPPLTTVIEQAPGEASSKSAVVTLSSPFGPGIDALGGLCKRADYDANACPESSHVGDATAISPLLPQPLTGPVRLVEVPGALPQLVIYLGNDVVNSRLVANVSLSPTETSNTLDAIPDVPLSRFQLAFRGGPGGLLSLGKDLCKTGSTVNAAFTAHSGKTAAVAAPVDVQGCSQTVTPPPKVHKPRAAVTFRKLATKSPLMRLSVRKASGGKRLRAVTVTLPKGLSLRHGQRTLKLRPKRKAGVDRVSATLGRGKLVVSRSLRGRVHRHPRLRVTLRVTDAAGAKFTLRPSARAR